MSNEIEELRKKWEKRLGLFVAGQVCEFRTDFEGSLWRTLEEIIKDLKNLEKAK